MEGGEFHANTEGIPHYAKFGYKRRLAGAGDVERDAASSSWVRMNYTCNRGMLHDGDFPHLSTPVKHIKAGCKRVILGFNCFPHSIGEATMHAPEHSDAFNRTVKLYQTMAGMGVPITSAVGADEGKYSKADSDNPPLPPSGGSTATAAAPPKAKGGGISAKDVLKNPALARLLVAAAKKVKAEANK
jgi:hypothetical protein